MKIEHSLQHVHVLALELQAPLVVDPTVPVGEVIRTMRVAGLGYALIARDSQLVGIFTERDVFLSVIDNDRATDLPIADLMTPSPTCVGEQEPVWRVVTLMHDGGFRQIPVVDDAGGIAGCVRHKDIAEYLVNHFASHILNLPPDPEQVARLPEGG